MLVDTDVLIWYLKGNQAAAMLLSAAKERRISIVSYIELVQGARDKRELRTLKRELHALGFAILPLTPAIGQRAAFYIERYALSHGLRLADALVAATASELGVPLITSNIKHYRASDELEVTVFQP